MDNPGSIGSIFVSVYIIFTLLLVSAGIYGFVLFVRLAHRGIKALDLYIKEKTNL